MLFEQLAEVAAAAPPPEQDDDDTLTGHPRVLIKDVTAHENLGLEVLRAKALHKRRPQTTWDSGVSRDVMRALDRYEALREALRKIFIGVKFRRFTRWRERCELIRHQMKIVRAALMRAQNRQLSQANPTLAVTL
mgnify:CR=1 FL=1